MLRQGAQITLTGRVYVDSGRLFVGDVDVIDIMTRAMAGCRGAVSVSIDVQPLQAPPVEQPGQLRVEYK